MSAGAVPWLKMAAPLSEAGTETAIRGAGAMTYANRTSRQRLKDLDKKIAQGQQGLSDQAKGQRLARVQDAISARSKAAEADLARQKGQVAQGGAISGQQAEIIKGEQAGAALGASEIQKQSDVIGAREVAEAERLRATQRRINLDQTEKLADTWGDAARETAEAFDPTSGEIDAAGLADADEYLKKTKGEA